jgi:N-glycosidase YbiA
MILPGTTYQTNTNIKVKGTIHFDKPLSLGFDFDLPFGEDFKISIWTDPTDKLIQVWLLDPKKYESKIVERDVLASPFYDSYSLTISRDAIENSCSLLTDFEKAIYFYSPLDKFGELSNFAGFGFEYENLYYSTVEHFYQSRKFIDKDYSEQIRQAKTPKVAADMGKNRDKQIIADWDEIKNDIMTIGVQRKFDSHENLINLLLSTGENLIIENSPYDNYWGIGSTGDGLNQLGTSLMRVRQKLNNAL